MPEERARMMLPKDAEIRRLNFKDYMQEKP